jgi:hypothetical protein
MTIPTGATRLFSIIGDPVKYVESPTRLLSCNVDTDGIDRDGVDGARKLDGSGVRKVVGLVSLGTAVRP